ncbi:MAG: hypothetical protein KGH65_03775 [Candidatus Micrarchaeota archaeon]|nr:hypothetical protein [Candidatus Micrarchaeota archaeon]
MPYKSLAQERYFNANRGKMEGADVDVDEWNAASKGKKLPKRAPKKKAKMKYSEYRNMGHSQFEKLK